MNETTRIDMHVHASASALSKLGVQRSLGIPECAVHAGRAQTQGAQGSAAKWAHAAIALATRTIGRETSGQSVDPSAVLKIVQRLLKRGQRSLRGRARRPRTGRHGALLEAWTAAMGPESDQAGVVA